MTLCIVLVCICVLLFCVCRAAVLTPPAETLVEWLDAMLGTFLRAEELIMMRKALICALIGAAMLTMTAYAQEDEPPYEVEFFDAEEPADALDAEETAEPSPTDEEPSPTAAEASPTPDPAGDAGGDPDVDATPRVILSLGDDETEEANATPEPEETPDPDVEYMTYEDEVLTTLGTIQGFLLFFVVVLVCWLVYKFFRIFF